MLKTYLDEGGSAFFFGVYRYNTVEMGAKDWSVTEKIGVVIGAVVLWGVFQVAVTKASNGIWVRFWTPIIEQDEQNRANDGADHLRCGLFPTPKRRGHPHRSEFQKGDSQHPTR